MRASSRLSGGGLLLLFFAATSCAYNPASLEGFKHPERGGLKRAAFELQCPEQDLQLVTLSETTIGVTGCDKRAVYKWIRGAGWVNNTGGEDSKSEQK